jgi:hypothetical protein
VSPCRVIPPISGPIESAFRPHRENEYLDVEMNDDDLQSTGLTTVKLILYMREIAAVQSTHALTSRASRWTEEEWERDRGSKERLTV